MDPRPLFIANWKMHLTEPEVTTYLNKFKPLIFETEGRAVVVAPAHTSLKTAAILTERARMYIGAQDVSPEAEGALSTPFILWTQQRKTRSTLQPEWYMSTSVSILSGESSCFTNLSP